MNNTNTETELSIIVPNYNNGDYIDDCINSILSQTYTNYEIIIIDDCSTDNSIEILKNWEGKNHKIRVIYNKKNIGVTRSRHIAITNAKGKYITSIDSDDIYYDKKKLELEIELVKQYKISGKSICSFSNTAFLDEQLNFKSIRGTEEKIREGSILNYIITRDCEIPIM